MGRKSKFSVHDAPPLCSARSEALHARFGLVEKNSSNVPMTVTTYGESLEGPNDELYTARVEIKKILHTRYPTKVFSEGKKKSAINEDGYFMLQ